MPAANFLDASTQEIVKGINFGGPIAYKVGDTIVYAPTGGESISLAGNILTLEPLGLTSSAEGSWTVSNRTFNGDGTWYSDLTNTATGDIIINVLEFNSSGVYYITECDSVAVMASCGGYKVEDTWDGQAANEWKRLVHVDGSFEILTKWVAVANKNGYVGTGFTLLSDTTMCAGISNPCYTPNSTDDACGVYGKGISGCGGYISTPPCLDYGNQACIDTAEAAFNDAFPIAEVWAEGTISDYAEQQGWISHDIVLGAIVYPNRDPVYNPDSNVDMYRSYSITNIKDRS